MMSGAWFGFGNQSRMTVSFSAAAATWAVAKIEIKNKIIFDWINTLYLFTVRKNNFIRFNFN